MAWDSIDWTLVGLNAGVWTLQDRLSLTSDIKPGLWHTLTWKKLGAMAPFAFSNKCVGGPRSRLIWATYMAWDYSLLLRSFPSKRVVSVRSSRELWKIGYWYSEFVGSPYHSPQVPNDLNIAKSSYTDVANLKLAFIIRMTLLRRKGIIIFPQTLNWHGMVPGGQCSHR